MKKTGKYIAFIFFLLFSLSGYSQETSFYATVDKNPVKMGDVFSYKVTLANGRGNIQPPDLDDFRLVFGPSQSSQYSLSNGRQSSTLTLSYTLRPKKTGTFKIGQAKVQVDGKTYTSKPIEVKVVEGNSNGGSSNYDRRDQNRNTQASSDDENIILRINLNKREAYIGEQVTATYILLTRYQNLDVGDMRFPTLNGFWTEDLKDEKASWEREYEIVKGVPYRKAILKRQVLFPQRSGELKIESMEIEGRVNRSFFNPGREVTIVSNSPQIKVKSLPRSSPSNFKGAVGRFKFNVDVDRTELKANEAINLKIDISGTGNLPLTDAPEIEFPSDFEVYDPEVNDRINVSANGVSGRRRFQYLIIPRYPGEYTIDKISFTHFDPKSGKYETQTAGPFKFAVSGEGGTVPTTAQRRKNRVIPAANDIRYIFTNPSDLMVKGKMFYGSAGFYGLLAAPFILLLIFLAFRRRKESMEQDVIGSKKRRANRIAKQRLKDAEKALKKNDSKAFFAEVSKALYGYLEDKLVIPKSQLSKPVITEKLQSGNIEQQSIDKLFKTLELCEMARFAPMDSADEKSIFQQTVSLLETFENKLK